MAILNRRVPLVPIANKLPMLNQIKSNQINSNQFKSIQYLRGIAATAIVFRHLSDRTDKYNIIVPGFNGIDIGLWGVDLFFVISGFVMVYITKSDQAGFRYIFNFWIRRYLRISPLYYIMTMVIIFVAMYVPSSTELRPSIEHTINSLLYIPSYNLSPVLGVGWTLNYEMYFYLIFGLVLFFPEKYQTTTMTVWFSGSVLFGFFYQSDNAIILQITNPLLIEFLLGVFIGRFFREEKIWSVAHALIILSVSCLIIIFAELFDMGRELRFLFYGIPCAGLVSALIALEARKVIKFDTKLLLLAGEISFSLYLVHIFVIAGYGKFVMKFSLFEFTNGYILLSFDFIVCFLTATLISKLIEQPLHINLSKRVHI